LDRMKSLLFSLFGIFSLTSWSQSTFDFFELSDQLMSTYCTDGRVNYKAVKKDSLLPILIDHIAKDEIPSNDEKAYLINVYNLFVIHKVAEQYPINSPMDDSDFFTGKTFVLNGEKISLDYLENTLLRKKYADPRMHFALVCGAEGCPPIQNFSYKTNLLDQQLNAQTKTAVNNSEFVYQRDVDKTVYISEIFDWYQADFGKNKRAVIEYINGFREQPFNTSFTVSYYPYSWKLNELNPDAVTRVVPQDEINDVVITPSLQLYTAGSLLAQGRSDFTLFNTLYTETKQNWLGADITGYRATFMTHLFQYTLGITKSKRINLGFDISFRSSGYSVDSTISGLSPAFSYKNSGSSRVGITSAGVRLKVQPFKNVADFSIQSTLIAPTIKHPEGLYSDTGRVFYWADWNRITWWNQIYYTKTFGNFQLFTEIDFLFRFRVHESQIGMLELPTNLFLSYFPTKKITIYAMTQHVHRFTNDIDPENPVITDWVIPMNYTASGLGFKYQIGSSINIELLYTNFWRGRNSGLGNTFNIGVKYLTK
jgi:hypothetical protein